MGLHLCVADVADNDPEGTARGAVVCVLTGGAYVEPWGVGQKGVLTEPHRVRAGLGASLPLAD